MIMEKEYWFEVFRSTEEHGSETVETFDTEQEALEFIASQTEKLYYDEWESNKDGSGVAKRNPLYKIK